MRPSTALQNHRGAIRQIALSHRVTNVRVFGSMVQGDDTEGSGLDILVEPTPETTMMDIATIQSELKELLGLPVDVLTPRAIPDHFRAIVESEAVPV
jgi:predicted nucleotidyltransferase